MKIAIIGHLKHPIARPFAGGLEAFTFHLVRRLQDRGHDVTLFASGDSDPTLSLKPIIPVATVADSERRFGCRNHAWIDAHEDASYTALMKTLIGANFDVIHNNSISPIPLRYANLLPTEMITTLHVPVLPRLAEEIEDCGSSRCGRFVNISQSNATTWGRLLPVQDIIHNGVDTDFWKGCTETKSRRAIWFGRILPDKGPHLAIEASRRAGLPIDVVGPVADREYFETQIRPRLSQQSVYLGHQNHEQLCALLARASVAVATPCWDEPFGLVVAEALACGTPVAGFARGALAELIDDDIGRLVSPGDVKELARAIRSCHSLSGARCRRVAEERFSLGHMIDRYVSLYAEHCLGVPVA